MIEECNLEWSEPREVSAQGVRKKVRSATPTERFWDLWRVEKETLKKAGVTVSKFAGEWKVTHWQHEGEFVAPTLPEIIAESTLDLKSLVNERVLKILKPYQVLPTQVVIAAMERYGVSLNACGTGCGKTFMTLGAAREMGVKLVVICPKSITIDWIRAAFLFDVEIEAFGWEWIKTGKTPYGHWEYSYKNKKGGGQVKIKNKWVWTLPDGYALVGDEIHRSSGLDTQNSLIIQEAAANKIPLFMLSATIANDPTKMKASGQALGLHNGKDFYDWMARNGVHAQNLKIGGRTITIYKFSGSIEHLKVLHRRIFPNKGFRLKAEDIKDFPSTQIIAKAYEMDESVDIQKAYDEMRSKVDEIMAEKDNPNKQACILVEILRARQKVELLKVPLFVSLTRDALNEGMSVFIAVNFKDTLKELTEQLKIKSIIVGGQKDFERRDAIDNFQSNKRRIIIGIIQACREGLNLQDIHGGFPRLSLISPTQSAFDLKQVLGRTHREGGKTPSIQRIVFSSGTIEESVCEGLATKLDTMDVLCDGDLQKNIFPDSYSSMRPKSMP